MWELSIGTFKKHEDGSHTQIHRTPVATFVDRKEAEELMEETVYSNTDPTLKFLGFLKSPQGMHTTLDPTLMFWYNFHLSI